MVKVATVTDVDQSRSDLTGKKGRKLNAHLTIDFHDFSSIRDLKSSTPFDHVGPRFMGR